MDDANPILKKKGKLLIVSNRLPIVIAEEEGKLTSKGGSGGLVTALAPVLKNRGGLWIGWPGNSKATQEEVSQMIALENRKIGYTLCPIFLTQEEIRNYYEGFSNEIIWPLFHDLPSECNFNPKYWASAIETNEKFAQITNKHVQPDDFIWVQDYHLMLLGKELRQLKTQGRLAFFLHIPFPSPDIFFKLPWRFQVLRALFEYDLIGFQTLRDKRNFIQCARRLFPEMKIKSREHLHVIQLEDREVCIGAFPISIDFNEFSLTAAKNEVLEQAWLSQEKIMNQQIIFSLDRLDYTKGIPYRLEAIRLLLKNHPELHQKITFVQIVIPSRMEIPKYQNLKNEIDRLVGEINSAFTQSGWVPIQSLFRSISHQELVSYYRTSEVALVTPIKDGMNLVAKEFIASNVDEKGVLILSEFAGAVSQLHKEALLINPYDIEGLAQTIYEALHLSKNEKKARMRKMRRSVHNYDVYRWVQSFLTAAISKKLQDFPILEEYTPSS